MSRWTLALCCIAALLAAASAATADPIPTDPVALSVPVAGDAWMCDTYCSHLGCEAGEHWAVGTDEPEEGNANRNDGWHFQDCKAGTCEFTHGPLCEPTLAALPADRLIRMLQARDTEGVEAFMAAHPERVWVNVPRSAVQVADCTGVVVAHLPVSRDLVRSLTGD